MFIQRILLSNTPVFYQVLVLLFSFICSAVIFVCLSVCNFTHWKVKILQYFKQVEYRVKPNHCLWTTIWQQKKGLWGSEDENLSKTRFRIPSSIRFIPNVNISHPVAGKQAVKKKRQQLLKQLTFLVFLHLVEMSSLLCLWRVLLQDSVNDPVCFFLIWPVWGRGPLF